MRHLAKAPVERVTIGEEGYKPKLELIVYADGSGVRIKDAILGRSLSRDEMREMVADFQAILGDTKELYVNRYGPEEG